MEGGISCEEIPPESQLECVCPECVRELTFQYTGASCAETAEGCTQFGANPTTALIVISDALNAENQYFQGEVTIGDTIKIEDADCLPDGLIATTGVPVRLFFRCVSFLLHPCRLIIVVRHHHFGVSAHACVFMCMRELHGP